MKTKEELTQLKTEYETLNNKLKELSEEELKMVTGGVELNLDPVPDINDIGAGILAGRGRAKAVTGSLIDEDAIKKHLENIK